MLVKTKEEFLDPLYPSYFDPRLYMPLVSLMLDDNQN